MNAIPPPERTRFSKVIDVVVGVGLPASLLFLVMLMAKNSPNSRERN